MGLIFYFVLALLETSYLLYRVARVRSAPVEAVLWGYSRERWFLILFLVLVLVIIIRFLLRAVRRARGRPVRLNAFLNNDISVLRAVFASLFGALALFLILVQEPPFFSGLYPVYARLRPFFFWALLLSLQTFIFLLVWYGLRFTNARAAKKPRNSQSSLAVLIAFFLLLLLIKAAFIFPNSYGLIKRFGESKYILMARVFTEGVTLASYNNPPIFHYPFLYPITLSFAWAFQNHAFTAIRLMNAVFTASALFPLFLIARQLMGRKKALLIAALSGFLPFQFLIPLQVLSENLYIPLFLWTVFFIFAIPRRNRSRLAWDLLTGIFIGLLFLTRFITLAAIPFFLLLWWLKPFGKIRKVLRFPPRKLFHLLLLILCVAALYAPWLLFARRAGVTLRDAFGFGIAAHPNPQQLTWRHLFTWLLLYLAYFVLMLSPLLGLIFSLGRRQFRVARVRRWLAVVVVISLAFLFAIVRHSWRAAYNLELPARIMGRYIIFLPPLFLITAFLPLTVRPREPLTCRLSFLLRAILLPLVLVIFSYLLLISESIIPLKPGFISPFAAYDVYYFKLLGPWFWPFLLLVYFIPSLLMRGAKPKYTRQIIALLLGVFYTLALPNYADLITAAQVDQRLGSRVVALLRACGSPAGRQYHVYLPDTIAASRRAEIDWAIRVHNLSAEVLISAYAPAQPPGYARHPAILVTPITDASPLPPAAPFTDVFDHAFTLRLLDPDTACQ